MRWLPLLLVGCARHDPPAPAEPHVVTLLAMNDWHATLHEVLLPDGTAAGGLVWLKAAVDAARAEAPGALLLDGGDCFQGDPSVNAGHGIGAVDAFGLLGVDAAAVGNHEFDYGQGAGGHPLRGALEAAAQRRPDQWVTSNIWDGERPWVPDGMLPFKLLKSGPVTVGVFGLSTEETPSVTMAKNVADLRFEDVVDAAKRTIPALRAAGADVIVAVGHLTGKCKPEGPFEPPGDDCQPDGEIGALLAGVGDQLDVLVAGHAHTLLAQRIGRTFVLENRDRGTMLGRLDLWVGPDGQVDPDRSVLHKPWALTHAPVDPGCDDRPFPLDPLEVGGRLLTPSAEAVSLVARIEAEAGLSACAEVGCASRPLFRAREKESAVGNLMADAMLAASPGVDLALTNSGGLRQDLAKGPIRWRDAFAVMPFDNRLVTLTIDGASLLRALRIGSSGAHGILQLAGGTYHYDPTRTGGDDLDGDGEIEGFEVNRLCGATVGGRPIDPARTYRVVTTDFLVGGGDGLGVAFASATKDPPGVLARDALIEALGRHPTCVGEAEQPSSARPRVTVGPCAP